MVVPTEEWFRLLESWSHELLAATDRVDYLIGDRHQLTKGTHREMLLRSLLRRVLPDRYRVSTGFIYRFDGVPSRQLDVLIWDALGHSALLEDGELAILAPDAVAAIIEVKSVLDRRELRKTVKDLTLPWLLYWPHATERSLTGLPQQVPDIPVRAIFAYRSDPGSPDAVSEMVFSELASFYRERFMGDARAVLEQRGDGVWMNLLDAICIATGPEIEQVDVRATCADGSHHSTPGFMSCLGGPDRGRLSVGRFCMYLLWRLTGWKAADAAKMTLRVPGSFANPGVCAFGELPGELETLRVWAAEADVGALWRPNPPLWKLDASRPL